jgi:hypothetical protein
LALEILSGVRREDQRANIARNGDIRW